VLQPVNDAVRACGLVAGSMATLISELKVDIIKVPDLTQILSTQEGTDSVKMRFATANAAKSVINTVLLDKDEDWQRVSANLNDVPNVISTYLQLASGAADIPATRFLGMAPHGLNATGESDLRNYYDRVRSEQSTTLTPAMSVLDEVIIRSALGSRPPEIWYQWNSLWQITPTDKAEIALKKAQAYRIDADEGQIPATALAQGRINQLIEDGVYPGLEAALAASEAEGESVEEWNKTPPIPTQPREQVRPAGTAPPGPGQLPEQIPHAELTGPPSPPPPA
jgi:hypothetical protein